MPGPPAAVAQVRLAVRRAIAAVPGQLVVACSGGADSLALAAATAFEARGRGVGAVVVDHGLQPGSAQVAERAAAQCRDLGLDPVEIHRVQVGSAGGREAAARTARYRVLEQVAARDRATVLLGHTRDDQAESVLLGLVRGSGARSLSGMPPARLPFLRPLLGVAREVTRAACEAERLVWWDDPHNADPAYLRVRVRRLLPRLEAEIGPGVVAGLVRSADLLREDADLLDQLARGARSDLQQPTAPALAALPAALRTRVWRLLAVEAGAPAGSLFAVHVRALDTLVTGWTGQGPVDLPGGVRAERVGDVVRFTTRW
ncbi:MAG TPA: tRNA lysidine(34) synthetase TilS [Dermatophilaceae bacterium]|nr:tRNA lysidine(34) synthetase TilS [Dermatophilaceae bacterium]